MDIEICTNSRLSATGLFPRILGHGSRDSLPFIVLPLANEGNLVRMLYTDHDWNTRVGILHQIALGVQALHTEGILHGDIKLENVLVTKDPGTNKYRAQLADFSHVVYLDGPARVYYGTPPYLPPEIWLDGDLFASLASDMWTFCMLFWRVCQYRDDSLTAQLSLLTAEAEPTLANISQSTSPLEKYMTLCRNLENDLLDSRTVDKQAQETVVKIFHSCSAGKDQRPTSIGFICDLLQRCKVEAENSSDLEERTRQMSLGSSNSDTAVAHDDFSIIKMFQDRAVWEVQKDFITELRTFALNADQVRAQRFETILIPFCQALGFGCARELQPLHQIMTKDAANLQNSEPPILWCLKVLEEALPMVRASITIPEQDLSSTVASNERRDEPNDKRSDDLPEDEAIALPAISADLVGGFTEDMNLEDYREMIWLAVRYDLPAVAIFIAGLVNAAGVEPVWGTNALHMLWNVNADSIETVAEALVKNGAEIDLISPAVKQPFVCSSNHLTMTGSPLAWATMAGNEAAVRTLVELGADPTCGSMSEDDQPLSLATSQYRPEILKVLLQSPKVAQIQSPVQRDKVAGNLLLALGPAIGKELRRVVLHGERCKELAWQTLAVVLDYFPEEERPFFLELLITLNVFINYLGNNTIFSTYFLDVVLQRRAAELSPVPEERRAEIMHGMVLLHEREGENLDLFLDTAIPKYPSILDVNAKSSDEQRTVLHLAAIFNTSTLIPILIRHGARLNEPDLDQVTPLGLAARMGSTEAFESLLSFGASITHALGTVLHNASMNVTSFCLVPYILNESASRALFHDPAILEATLASELCFTALGLSVLEAELESVRALLRAGANPHARATLPGFEVAMSVRELATLLYYRPSMRDGTKTWQKREQLDPGEQLERSAAIKRELYALCENEGFEEAGSLSFVQREENMGGKGYISILIHARKRREGEGGCGFISLDVKPVKPERAGLSMWDTEIDLREEEGIHMFQFPFVNNKA